MNKSTQTALITLVAIAIGFVAGRLSKSRSTEQRIEKRLEVDMRTNGEDLSGANGSRNEVEALVDELMKTGFEGDTVLQVGGAEVNISITEDNVSVSM